MQLKRLFSVVMAVMALVAFSLPLNGLQAFAAGNNAPRIAILDFNTLEGLPWFTAYIPSQGIPDQIVNKLMNQHGGTYRLIERNALSKILQEQNLSAAGNITPQQAVEMGKMLGADAIVTGTVTLGYGDEGMNTQAAGVAGGAIGGLAGYLTSGLAGNLGSDKYTARAVVRARMIDTTTGEILGAAESEGIADKKSAKIGGLFTKRVGSQREMLVQKAIENATDQVANKLVSFAPQVAVTSHAIECTVADVTGGVVTLTKGDEAGLKAGDKLAVQKVIKEIKHPTTGEVIRQVKEEIAKIQITKAGKGYAEATVVSGNPAAIAVGNKAETL